MRKLVTAGMLVLAGCSGKGEIIPTPSPEPHTPTTTEQLTSPVTEAPEPTSSVPAVQEAVEEVVEAATTTTVVTVRVRATTTTEYLREQATTQPVSAWPANSATPPEYIKQCESRGNYQAVNPNGHYGAWQFSQSTWESVGGTGRPDYASPAEQDYRASILWDNGRGASHWECA